MPRDVLTPADLLGRIQMLNVACVKCGRGGRYRVKTLVREIGLDGNIANWLSGLSADCPHRKAAALSDRCDVRCPDLSNLARQNGGDDAS
jgi:hypothetical protein